MSGVSLANVLDVNTTRINTVQSMAIIVSVFALTILILTGITLSMRIRRHHRLEDYQVRYYTKCLLISAIIIVFIWMFNSGHDTNEPINWDNDNHALQKRYMIWKFINEIILVSTMIIGCFGIDTFILASKDQYEEQNDEEMNLVNEKPVARGARVTRSRSLRK